MIKRSRRKAWALLLDEVQAAWGDALNHLNNRQKCWYCSPACSTASSMPQDRRAHRVRWAEYREGRRRRSERGRGSGRGRVHWGERRSPETSPSGSGLVVRHQTGGGDCADTQQSLQQRATTGTGAKLPGQRIETVLVHENTLGAVMKLSRRGAP